MLSLKHTEKVVYKNSKKLLTVTGLKIGSLVTSTLSFTGTFSVVSCRMKCYSAPSCEMEQSLTNACCGLFICSSNSAALISIREIAESSNSDVGWFRSLRSVLSHTHIMLLLHHLTSCIQYFGGVFPVPGDILL